eukprot:1855279-Rhodomonas_salina.1
MCGTELGYAATVLTAMCGTELGSGTCSRYGAGPGLLSTSTSSLPPPTSSKRARYLPPIRLVAFGPESIGAVCIRACYVVSGTDAARARRESENSVHVTGTIELLGLERIPSLGAASGLRVCYAMPGTELVYATVGLRACYAMPSTELAYAACCYQSGHTRSSSY